MAVSPTEEALVVVLRNNQMFLLGLPGADTSKASC
jgi:hypothetical protein